MADDRYLLTQLFLSGFRAYLHPRAFDFSSKRNLAVFAPNGSGKSSIIDAIEFMFSAEGTLERLGERAINNQAGPIALTHYLAEDKKIESKVAIAFSKGLKKHEGSRTAIGKNRPRPEIATEVISNCLVNPIIRGYSLRAFVEEHKAEKRYEDVVHWLELGPLVKAQRHLRELRRQTKALTEDKSSFRKIDQSLRTATNDKIATWDEVQILAFANGLLTPLDKLLSIKALDLTDPAIEILKSRVDEEERRVGLDGLRQIHRAVTTIYSAEEAKPLAEKTAPTGRLAEFETAYTNLQAAEAKEKDEKNAAANAIFAKIWDSAAPLFAVGAPTIDTCPICATPISKTQAGSIEGIREHISQHRKELKQYAAAKQELENARTQLTKTRANLIAAINAILPLFNEKDASLKETLLGYQKPLESGQETISLAKAESAKIELLKMTETLQAKITAIESEQGESTYRKVQNEVRRLIELRTERQQTAQIQKQLTKLLEQLNLQSAFISTEIRKRVQTLLNSLQHPINDIYRQIQGNESAPIRLLLPSEEETNQQRLNLVIDFSESRESVQPSGYLSDSQIHSLALALRLAAIRKFNPNVPLIALDDIVTSYDANHRRAISALLAKEFSTAQIIITTHDERFFNYLKDQLGDKDWHYTRIIRFDKDFGPRFIDQRISDQMIEERWNHGQHAANEIRQAEEEWLLSMCRDFGVDIRIRTVEKAYSYERSELAEALARFLKSRGLTPPMVPGVNNRFLSSLKQGTIENFGSHFQDGPFGDGSTGDEKARWNEFVYFRSQFKCAKCGKLRFKRPMGMERAVCAAEKCETPLEFSSTK